MPDCTWGCARRDIRLRSWRSVFTLSWTRGVDGVDRRRPRGFGDVLEVEYALIWASFKPRMSSGWNPHRKVVWRSTWSSSTAHRRGGLLGP